MALGVLALKNMIKLYILIVELEKFLMVMIVLHSAATIDRESFQTDIVNIVQHSKRHHQLIHSIAHQKNALSTRKLHHMENVKNALLSNLVEDFTVLNLNASQTNI